MSEITAALDEGAANQLLGIAVAALPPFTSSGSNSLGPFVAGYSITGTLSSGVVDLIAPDIIRIADLKLNWQLSLSFSFDLSTILPDFCLPQICVTIPCIGRVCTPRICIDWPTISIPVSFGDFVKATADFTPSITLNAGVWHIDAVVQGVPNLQFGAATAGLLAAIGLAATPVLLAIPFLGPFLAIAVNGILLAVGIAGVTGFLGPIISPFVSGLKIPIYTQPQLFEVLPNEGPFDPKVLIKIDALGATVQSTNEDELVLTADVSS
jgi:hypothetical protein